MTLSTILREELGPQFSPAKLGRIVERVENERADFINCDRPGREPEGTHAFIQWKGTDVCMDFHCDCGEHNHFDGSFAYVVKCAGCGVEWEMPAFLYPRKRCAQTYSGHTAQLMEGDDADEPLPNPPAG